MKTVYRDSLEAMSRQASEISIYLQREKLAIEDLTAYQDVSSLPRCQLMEDLTEVFKIMDKNGDGKISQEELGNIVRSLGDNPTASDLEWMMKEVDADGDGQIDLQEFLHLNTVGLGGISGHDTASLQDAMQDAFHVFDLDKNGLICAGELYRVLSGLGDEDLTLEECRYMIKSVDRDDDEMVDFKEFQEMMSAGFLVPAA